MFFMRPRKQNRGLYRSAAGSEGFAKLGRVEPAVADQLTVHQQHGHFQSIAPARLRVGVHIGEFQRTPADLGHRLERMQHLLAQGALGARVQQQIGPERACQRGEPFAVIE